MQKKNLHFILNTRKLTGIYKLSVMILPHCQRFARLERDGMNFV